MKIENIPADIKSKSLKEARDEINEIFKWSKAKDVDLKALLKIIRSTNLIGEQ